MGAGGSVAQELASPRLHHHGKTRGPSVESPAGCQYRQMLDHLRHRFEEELDVLRKKHGEVDRDALVVKLLLEEFSFTTVEVADLPALKSRQRDWGKVYLLGESHFCQTPPSANVDMTTLTPKALEMAGDDQLFAEAREALPTKTKTSKKAVELMGSTKVVTEKKALKRLGSEMTDDMRALQIKTERKEQKQEENRRLQNSISSPDLPAGAAERGEGAAVEGGAGGAGVAAAAAAAAAAGDGAGPVASPRKRSVVNMRIGSPGSFASTPMARRATRLLTEVPKFISEMGASGSSSSKIGTPK